MKRPRVLLADDHKLLLEAFQKLLEPDCEVVGSVADGRALLAAASELEPDIIVLDIAMPLLNGLDAGGQIKKMMPDVKLIFLTVNEDPDFVSEAFRIGASGYLLKSSAASELFQAIQDVSRGRAYVTPLVAQGMVDSFIEGPKRRRASDKLTPRQREVLQLLAAGRSRHTERDPENRRLPQVPHDGGTQAQDECRADPIRRQAGPHAELVAPPVTFDSPKLVLLPVARRP